MTLGKMSAFEVYVNGRRLCTAALQSDGVLTTMLTFFRGAGPKGKRVEEAKLTVGSLVSDSQTFLDWLPRNISVGEGKDRVHGEEARRPTQSKAARDEGSA